VRIFKLDKKTSCRRFVQRWPVPGALTHIGPTTPRLRVFDLLRFRGLLFDLLLLRPLDLLLLRFRGLLALRERERDFRTYDAPVTDPESASARSAIRWRILRDVSLIDFFTLEYFRFRESHDDRTDDRTRLTLSPSFASRFAAESLMAYPVD
jgi:hypothetical protein